MTRNASLINRRRTLMRMAVLGTGAAVSASGWITPAAALAQAATPVAVALPLEQGAFHDQMRKLWEDHVTWTRLYIVSFAAALPDQDLTAQRLLRNQTDLGNAITPFYGEAAGSQLTKLLETHIQGAGDLLKAAKRGDRSAVTIASDNWYVNANAIAAFLHQANPAAWPLAALQAQMKMHLDLTLHEATNRLHGNFAADIADYDQVHDHILKLADLLSSGIMQQFPDKFA